MKCADIQETELASYYRKYIEQLPQESTITEAQKSASKSMIQLVESLSEAQILYCYAQGKWTIKEIMVHLMDAERIFCYRALRFARKDTTELPGFNHDSYIEPSQANIRSKQSILEEYGSLRKSTILFFEKLTAKALTRIGTASKSPFSVQAIGFLIAGHETHHMRIIRERYL